MRFWEFRLEVPQGGRLPMPAAAAAQVIAAIPAQLFNSMGLPAGLESNSMLLQITWKDEFIII